MVTVTSPSCCLRADEVRRSFPKKGGICGEQRGVVLSIWQEYYMMLICTFQFLPSLKQPQFLILILNLHSVKLLPYACSSFCCFSIHQFLSYMQTASVMIDSEIDNFQSVSELNMYGRKIFAYCASQRQKNDTHSIIFIYIKECQNNMSSLQDYASNEQHPLFPNATQLPEFFEQNLVDPARVVKVFENDPQANIRVFYYQYLKLCFDLDTVDYEGYISKIEQILNNQGFKFVFFEDDDPSIFGDLQFKNLIMQFFGVLGQGNVSVEQALMRYPIMDTVMIYFFRAILILTGRADALDSYIQRQELLQYLCNYFGVEISFHDKCIKFVQTDIFVYEQNPREVFMAYMDYEEATNEANKSQRQATAQQYQPAQHDIVPEVDIPKNVTNQALYPPPASNSSRRGNEVVNNSYISSEFVDYTDSKAHLANLVHPNNLKESGSIEDAVHKHIHSGTDLPPKPPSKKKIEEPQATYVQKREQLPSYGDSYTYSSQSNSQSYGISSFTDKSPYTTLGMSNSVQEQPKIDTPLPKKEENKYSFEQQKQLIQESSLNKFSINSLPPIQDYQKPPPPAVVPVVIAQPIYQQSQDLIISDSFKKNPSKPSSFTASASEAYNSTEAKKPLSTQAYKPTAAYVPNYYPINQNQYVGPQPMAASTGKGKPFNLNVSLQFTNSITMKAMSQPYKTNVYNIRQRARNYRDSLIKFIK